MSLAAKALKILCRWGTWWDAPAAISMLIGNAKANGFDPGVMGYPTTRIVRSEDEDGVVLAYMPVHTTVTLESVGFAEHMMPEDKLVAVTAMTALVADEACRSGVREIYFLSSHGRTDAAAMSALGFEPVTAYRKRLSCVS